MSIPLPDAKGKNTMTDDVSTSHPDLLELATELTIAWLANPNTRASGEEVPAFLEKMHGAVAAIAGQKLGGEAEANAQVEYTPAVSVRRSLASKDHIISLIDGKPYKSLKRHLSTQGLTPAEYRQRYGLKADYPMVAENYSASRREIAKKLGLGRKPAAKADTAPAAASAAPAEDKPATGPSRSTRPNPPKQ
jgi:predicted transcriptional regulator